MQQQDDWGIHQDRASLKMFPREACCESYNHQEVNAMKNLETLHTDNQVKDATENVEIKYESFAEKKLKEIYKDIRKQFKTSMAVLASGLVLSALFIVASIMTKSVLFLFLGIASVMFTFGFFEFRNFSIDRLRQAVSLQSGIAGEASFASTLKEVAPPYHAIIYNYATPRGDIDAIVVGKTGVYVFEVKNVKGFLTAEGEEWKRYKVSSYGNAYSVAANNYVLQAKRNANYIKKLLSNKNIYVSVDYYVVFTHKDLKIDDKLKSERMFHLQEFKSNFKWNKETLSDKQVEQILKALDLAVNKQ